MAKAAEYFARLRQKSRPADAGSMPLTYYNDLFLTDKAAANASHSYLRELNRALQAFNHFLTEALERAPLLSDLTLDAARAFSLYEADQVRWAEHPIHSKNPNIRPRPLSPTTVRLNVRYIRTFAAWLYQEEWTRDERGQPVHVLQRLELPKAPKKEIRPLTQEEEVKLFRTCDDRTRDGSRRLALLLLFLDTGARLNEIAGLRVRDVDFTRGTIHITWQTAKGKKERSVAFGAKTERALKRYGLVFRDPPLATATPEESFFLSPDGEPLTGHAIYQSFKRMGKRAGLTDFHPHILRHTSGTRDIERGKSTREVQNKLGHSSVAVTERYTHIVEQETANRKRDSHVDDLPVVVRKTRK